MAGWGKGGVTREQSKKRGGERYKDRLAHGPGFDYSKTQPSTNCFTWNLERWQFCDTFTYIQMYSKVHVDEQWPQKSRDKKKEMQEEWEI